MASSAFSSALDPITGYEDLRDLTHPRHALTQFYRAFNTRDIVLMRQNWSPSDDISMNNPLGGIKRGWPEFVASTSGSSPAPFASPSNSPTILSTFPETSF